MLDRSSKQLDAGFTRQDERTQQLSELAVDLAHIRQLLDLEE